MRELSNSIALKNEPLPQIFNTEESFKVKDLKNRGKICLDITDQKVTDDHTLIRGKFYKKELRKGLFLHGGDTIEEHAFTATSKIDQGLSCLFFFKGEIDITIGEQEFNFNNSINRHTVAAAFKPSKERFRRVTKQSQRVQYLVITATNEWLDAGGVETHYLNRLLNRQSMTALSWSPSARLNHLLSEILSPNNKLPCLANLYLESRVIEVIAEVISTLMQTETFLIENSQLSRHDKTRLKRAESFIENNLEKTLSIEQIAKQIGVSQSGLQRLFQRAKNQTVFAYIRQSRLELAKRKIQHEKLSIKHVSQLVGFNSPANFATAFKKRFGYSPSQINKTPNQLDEEYQQLEASKLR